MPNSLRCRRLPYGWRYSLRFALLSITVAGVALGIWTGRAREQRMAVARLRAAHAQVIYQGSPCDLVTGRQNIELSPWERWIDWFGIDYFRNVECVFGCTACDLDAAARLRSLRALELIGDADDSDLAEIRRCTSLKCLSISSPHLGDETLLRVGQLPVIEQVDLYGHGQEISARGLAGLAQASSLRSVVVHGCANSVTAADVEPFRRSGKVEELVIVCSYRFSAKEIAGW